MKKSFSYIVATFFLIISSCTDEIVYSKYDLLDPAGTIELTSDSTQINLKDYIPTLESINSIIVKGIEIIYNENDFENIILVKSDTTKVLSSLSIRLKGEHVDLLVINNKSKNYSESPFIYTLRADNNSIDILIDSTIKDYRVFWQNQELSKNFISENSENGYGKIIKVRVPAASNDFDRSYFRVYSASDSTVSNDILIPLIKGKVVRSTESLKRLDKHYQILYNLMVDRFLDADSSNTVKLNSPNVLPPVDYMGGDLQGVLNKLKSGFFKDLGINSLWLSPISQNPYDAWGQIFKPKTQFSGYHGYWPIFITQIDKRFGNDSLLREIITIAHKQNINILLDYVSNHMHINSPTLKAHPNWVTSNVTPDGRPNFQLWDEFRLTTWFDKHIPSLDLEKKEVYEPMTDSALYWLKNFDIDGFRHDATKHVPEVYWRTLTHKIIKNFPKRSFYQIGETYGSPQLINSYVKKGMLDAQFDFNLYDSFVYSVIDTNGSFENLANTLTQSLRSYGYHNLMGNITGNHDRPRFISLAGGALSKDEDSKLAGWMRKIDVGNDIGYSRLSLLHAFIFTIPGIPCIYYGDDYGEPGANDPDNRRAMRFDGYSENEIIINKNLKELINLRKNNISLIYGETKIIYVSKDVVIFTRNYLDNYAIVCINKSSKLANLSIKTPFKISVDNFNTISSSLNFKKPIIIGDSQLGLTIEANSYLIINK